MRATPPVHRVSAACGLSLALAASLLAGSACRVPRDAGPAIANAGTPVSAADARQQQILLSNAGKPGDPDLMSLFEAINAKHFGGALPPTAVRWEPALAEVGPLSGHDITLQGMFGQAGSSTLILINPGLRADRHALDGALCHEMVHAYLFTMGDRTTSHGPDFQNVLRRLATEGAFEGIAAGAGEKARLREWLDAESARIDEERRDTAALDLEIRETRAELDREIAQFNARASRPAAEAKDLEARRQRFNQRVLEANERLQRDRDDLALFNREVGRYNLMMAYPDGLDEQSVMPKKKKLSGS